MSNTPAVRAIRAAGWPAQPYATDTLIANGIIYSGPCLLRGWSICNKNASAADFELYDGVDTNGTPVAFFHLTSGQNINQFCGSGGVMCDIGLFITIGATPLKGSIWATPLDDHELEMVARHYRDMTSGEGHGP